MNNEAFKMSFSNKYFLIYLFLNAVKTKGQSFRASFGKNPKFQIQLDKRPLSPGTSREAHWSEWAFVCCLILSAIAQVLLFHSFSLKGHHGAESLL